MNNRSHYLVLFLLAFSFRCATASQPQQPVTTPAPLDTDAASAKICQLAESNLLRLGCKDSTDHLLGGMNKQGQPFSLVCQNSMHNHENINPTCLGQVTSCDKVSSCQQ